MKESKWRHIPRWQTFNWGFDFRSVFSHQSGRLFSHALYKDTFFADDSRGFCGSGKYLHEFAIICQAFLLGYTWQFSMTFQSNEDIFNCRDLTSYECTNWRTLCDYLFVFIFLMLKISLKFHRVTIVTFHQMPF